MKKLFFLDIGMRNLLYNDFNEIDIRIDNGNIFENFIFLELLKSMEKFHKINYYRTIDGSVIDFIVEKPGALLPIEVKYRDLVGPVSMKSLENFADIQNVPVSYLINKNYYNISNMKNNKKVVFVAGLLASKIIESKVNQ